MKTWFITGASSGLGRELVAQLLRRGHRVAATLRDPDVLPEQANLWRAKLDVVDGTAVREVIGRAFRELGRIDVVVSNAGYGLFGAAEELPEEQLRAVIETNLFGSMNVIRAALPHLRQQRGGRILQVSSEGGQVAYPGFSGYHAAKWGIEGFVEAVAQEVAAFGIEFTLVEPGPTRTGFGAALVQPPPSSAYQETPVGALRRAFASGSFDLKGDAARTIERMIASAEGTRAPKRLTLGSVAYASIHKALTERLALLEEQREVAFGADS
jgi:NAD(P)-dependent dehydrogenase (short-subunit alcohol dehydrogenase family)